MDLANIYVSFHWTIVTALVGVMLSIGIWGVRCFRIGLNPAHRNVKLPYLAVTAIVWALIILIITI